mgnify:CR=1 FL=1
MTQINNNAIEGITEVLMANGFEKAVPQIMEIVLNSAMRAERDEFLKAAPYERTDERVDKKSDKGTRRNVRITSKFYSRISLYKGAG